MISTAIMAHPVRRAFVNDLLVELPDATVVWDEINDRWDTGRRAVLAYDPAAEWHVVVQDDAILCENFVAGVEHALAAVPAGNPVSFYTGKTRPYKSAIKRAVLEATANEKRWLSMRGPLWGVAVALPIARIEEMVAECDGWKIPNYDMRMAEWFSLRHVDCWYSIPSLVDHRVGVENPSLVPGRGAAPARTAHRFIQGLDPTHIDWNTEAFRVGDPSVPWSGDFQCSRCAHQSADLIGSIVHANECHRLGPVDFVASTRHHAAMLDAIRDALPAKLVGASYMIEPELAGRVSAAYRVVKRARMSQVLAASNHLVITGAFRDLRYIGDRSGWSLDGFAT